MPYNPGVEDRSGAIRAQGRMALGQGVAEGFNTFMQNKTRNTALQKQNEALIKAFMVDDETKKYAPEGLDKFIDKSISGGGLSLKDNIALNGMLNTTLATKREIQEQNLKAQESDAIKQRLALSQAQMARQERDRAGLAKTIQEFIKPAVDGESPPPDMRRFMEIGVTNSVSPETLAQFMPAADAMIPKDGGNLVFRSMDEARKAISPTEWDFKAEVRKDGSVVIPRGSVNARAPSRTNATLAGNEIVVTDDTGKEVNRIPVAPTGFERDPKTGSLRPIAGSEQDAKRRAETAALKNKEAGANEHASLVVGTIDKILGSEKVGPTTAGIVGAAARGIPGTAAFDLSAEVDTIRALIGFDELRKMREASPTGGALGQVAVKELEFLQAARGNLDTRQSPEQLKKNLEQIRESYARWQKAVNGVNPDDKKAAADPKSNAEEAKAPALPSGWTIKK